VSDVRFNEGDRVSPRPLARIDPERYRLGGAGGATLRQSQAERGRAEADLERREALFASQRWRSKN
jgi:hypothetical protein